MFNIGGGELIVILLIALIVLGPQRLPDAARQLGKAMGDLRRLSTGFQTEMKQALETADDPARVATRRNVLTQDPAPVADPLPGDDQAVEDAPAPTIEPQDPVADSIAAVSAQPSAPGKQTPPAGEARTAARKQAPNATPEPPAPPTVT